MGSQSELERPRGTPSWLANHRSYCSVFAACSQFWSRWCCGRWPPLLFCLSQLLVDALCFVSCFAAWRLPRRLPSFVYRLCCKYFCCWCCKRWRPEIVRRFIRSGAGMLLYGADDQAWLWADVLLVLFVFFSPSLCRKRTWCLSAVQYGSTSFNPSTRHSIHWWPGSSPGKLLHCFCAVCPSIAIKQV